MRHAIYTLVWAAIIALGLWILPGVLGAVPDRTITGHDVVMGFAVFALFFAFAKIIGHVFRAVAPKAEIGPSVGRAMTMPGISLIERAQHEAAHAVVVRALGHELRYVETTTVGGSGGRTAWRHRDEQNLTPVTVSFDRMVVALAGPVQEGTARPAGSGALGIDGDDHAVTLRVALTLSTSTGESRSVAELLDAATKQARRIVEVHADDIERLTEALCLGDEERSLTGDQVEQLLGVGDDKRSDDQN